MHLGLDAVERYSGVEGSRHRDGGNGGEAGDKIILL